MMLVYNLPQTDAIFDRFGGVAGSAYFVGGLGMTALTSGDGHMVLDPFRTRAAARSQFRVSQIHGTPDLEPLLRSRPLPVRNRRRIALCMPHSGEALRDDGICGR
jgi:hypothetical protein